MPKFIVQEQKDLTILPPDSILYLKVDEISTREVDGRSGKWEKLEFKFKILGIQAVGAGGGSPDDYSEVIASPIWGSVPARLTESPENRLRQWAEAILGVQMGVGFELDTDLLVGRECRGLTTQYDKRTTNPTTGQPNKGHQIDSLLPQAGGFGQPQQQFQPQQQYQQQPPQQWAPPAQPAQPAQQPLDPWAAQAQPQQQYQQPAQQPQPAQQGAQQGWGQPNGQSWEEPPF